ncbi:MAG: class I SAM-dependent methyltransferase, partial [Acidimicrobiales bacterium]
VVEVLGSAGELPGAGVRLFPGDLFETVAPGPFDMVFCAGVTDSYEAESVVRLLGQARSAMAPGGRVVLMSFIRGSHPAAVFFSVMMTASGSRADTHTEEDYRRWLAANSLHLDEVVEVEAGRHTLLVASEER